MVVLHDTLYRIMGLGNPVAQQQSVTNVYYDINSLPVCQEQIFLFYIKFLWPFHGMPGRKKHRTPILQIDTLT